MDIQSNTNNKTATSDEQQFKSTKEIINNIIEIFANNILSISDAEYILKQVSEELYKQPVTIIDDHIKQIYKMRNTGKIK